MILIVWSKDGSAMHSYLDMIIEATTTSEEEEEGDTFSFDNEGILCEGEGVEAWLQLHAMSWAGTTRAASWPLYLARLCVRLEPSRSVAKHSRRGLSVENW